MIHPSAIVDHSAKISADVEIGPFCVIGEDVEIDSGTIIQSHVVIKGPTRIGKNNQIFQFSSIGEAPQDKKYNGEKTSLEIGDNNIIREYCTFNRGTTDGNHKTIIGSQNLFMAYCHVAHDCIVGDETVFANAASLSGHVTVGDKATLGGFTSVHQFTAIGTQAFCGLGSVITRDIPPFSTAAGNRAKTVGINKEGLKRKGFSPEVIKALHRSFRLLLKSSRSRSEALEALKIDIEEHAEVKEFVDFVINSQRGIAK